MACPVGEFSAYTRSTLRSIIHFKEQNQTYKMKIVLKECLTDGEHVTTSEIVCLLLTHTSGLLI